MSRDPKLMTLSPPMEKCPMDFYQGVVFTAQIGNSSPTVNREEEICENM